MILGLGKIIGDISTKTLKDQLVLKSNRYITRNYYSIERLNIIEKYLIENRLIDKPLLLILKDIIDNIEIIKFGDEYKIKLEDDRLARLITYGNMDIKGEDILLRSFME